MPILWDIQALVLSWIPLNILSMIWPDEHEEEVDANVPVLQCMYYASFPGVLEKMIAYPVT